ncbi:hypothetical protein Tco_0884781 [Tanacetum coccineum]
MHGLQLSLQDLNPLIRLTPCCRNLYLVVADLLNVIIMMNQSRNKLTLLVPPSIDTVSSKRPTTGLYHPAKSNRAAMAKVSGMTRSGDGGSTAGGGDGHGGSGSGDGDTDGGGDSEGDLGLLRDDGGKSNGDGEDDDGKSDGGDVGISFPGRRAKAGLVGRGRVGGEWTTDVEAV